MKINNGMWLHREELDVKHPAQIYEYEVKEEKLVIYCPFIRVVHRGNTLDGGMLTGEISIFDGNVHFEFYHKKNLNKSKFEVKRKTSKIEIKEEANNIVLISSNISVVLNKDNCEIKILVDNIVRTVIPPKMLAYVVDENGKGYMKAGVTLDVDEKIFGLGERFGEYIKNGQSIEIWNQDGGTDSEQTYKNIPFFLSSKKFGLFVDHSEQVDFEVGSDLVSQNYFTVNNEYLRFDLILANTPKDIVGKFSKMTGDIPKLPEWSYGLWLSTSFTTDYSEETVLEFIDGMIAKDLPFEVFHFDCFWMKEYEWTNFEWNKELFKNPRGLIEKIHERGKKVCVWINPYIGQKSSVFDECYQKGYFIEGENGKPWQIDLWQPGLAVIDFTNPQACEWYKNKLKTLLDMGVDTFKTDFGERIPVPGRFYKTNTVKYFDNSDPYEMHNYYTYIYNKVVFEAILEKSKEPCLFARSGTVGSQSFPVHWGGDCLSNYVSMAESLRGGLSLSISGYAYWSHDIGGFEAGCEPDIYKRWTQFGLLSSHSRYHGNSEYKVPWLYGEEAVEVTRKFTKLKNSLMPYFRILENEATEYGYPLLRPLYLEYSYDEITRFIDSQYMLGDRLLVAPIFNNEGRCNYYLPKDKRWLNILDEKIYDGGQYYSGIFDYFTLPLLIPENNILIKKLNTNTTNFDCIDGIEVIAFGLIDKVVETIVVEGKEFELEVTEQGVQTSANIEVEFTYYK